MLSAPAWLVDPPSKELVVDPVVSHTTDDDGGDGKFRQNAASLELLPRLSNEARNIRLPTSLLQKAIRRRA
jgi:hypothetical protein